MGLVGFECPLRVGGGGGKLIETLLKSSFTFILTMPFELCQNMFYLKWKKPQCYMRFQKSGGL